MQALTAVRRGVCVPLRSGVVRNIVVQRTCPVVLPRVIGARNFSVDEEMSTPVKLVHELRAWQYLTQEDFPMISPQELRAILKKLPEDMSEKEVEDLIRRAPRDDNDETRIDLDEFVNMMRGATTQGGPGMPRGAS